MYKPYYSMYRKLRNMFNKKQMNMGKLNVFFLAMVVNINQWQCVVVWYTISLFRSLRL